MKRAAAALFLSASFHAAALFAADHVLRGDPLPPPAVMWVTLSAPARAEITDAAKIASLPKIEAASPQAAPKITPPRKEAQRKPADKPVPKKTKPAIKTATASLTQPESQPEQASSMPGSPSGEEETMLLPGSPQHDAGFAQAAMGRAIFDASSLKITKKVAPDYPMISRKRKESGTVVLLIEISSGSVESVEVESSSGHAPLDESAVRAVKMWKFDAGHGNVILARIPFKFDIQ